MNIIRTLGKVAIVMLLTAGLPAGILAQEYVSTPVTISKDKVKVNGEICWSHVVLERQTLFSISKAYDVPVDEIYRLNPSLKETGLKKNAIILIPAVQEKDQQNSQTKAQEARQERQQKLDSLTRVEKPVIADETPNRTVHVRKWYEDLNTIAEKYGVTPEAIMLANGLKSTRLSNRQKLIIPTKDAAESPAESETEIAETVKSDTVMTEVCEEPAWNHIPKDKVKATMLLPLKTADGRLSRNNMDFYSGALLAVYDLAAKGISIEFSMLDITDRSHPVTYEDIDGSDMVIGA